MEEATGRWEKTDEEEAPTFRVTDRRFWVNPKEGDGSQIEEQKPSSLYPTYVEQLKAQLEEQERKVQSYIQKVNEENEEFRKRTERELQKQIALYKGQFLERLLPVVDNLERALASAQTSENFMAFLEGIRLVHAQFLAQLKEEGVEPIEALHRPFDPVTDEAIGVEEVVDITQDNLVLQEIEKGYLVLGRLLRPAKVIVGKAKKAPEGNNNVEEK